VEETGKTDIPRTGALNTNHLDLAARREPAEYRFKSSIIVRDRVDPQHTTATAERTQPSCSNQLIRRSTAPTVRVKPTHHPTTAHPAGYRRLILLGTVGE
jgi:hypothetical protein